MNPIAGAGRTPRPLWIWGAATAAVILLATLATGLSRSPVRHQGRTVTDWMEQLNGPIGSDARRAAEAAFQAMGSEALPALEDILRERPWSFRVRLREFWHRWLDGKGQVLSYEGRQTWAMQALAHVLQAPGTDLARLVPHLRYHLAERSEVGAAWLLARAGPDGIACLTNLLWTGRPTVRDFAGFGLSQTPETQRWPGVRAALTRAAQGEEDPTLRSRFLLYLSLFEPEGDSPVVVPIALEAASSPDGAVRRSAVELLGRHRSDPRSIPALRRALDDAEPSVSAAARRLLGADGIAPPADR